jgi:hypothetical protein
LCWNTKPLEKRATKPKWKRSWRCGRWSFREGGMVVRWCAHVLVYNHRCAFCRRETCYSYMSAQSRDLPSHIWDSTSC